MQIDSKKLASMRGEILERFANIERLTDFVISQNYFGCIKKDFVLQVLYDELFSFGMKVKIVSKIPGNNPNTDALRKINKIRNRFAHSGITLNEYVDPADHSKGSIIKTPKPDKLDSDIDYSADYKEFMELAPLIEEYLFAEYKKKGGEYSE